jgi:hypothetical protein
MRFIERESVRYVLAGGLNTVTTHATYLVLLPLIGYAIAHSATYAARVRTRMCYRACWPSSCSPAGKRNAAKDDQACRVNGSESRPEIPRC